MTTPQPRPERVPAQVFGSSDAPVDSLDLAQLVAAGDLDVVPGDPPVPITIWRVAGPDTAYGHAGEELTPRLAGLLVGVYSRTGDTILALGDDPALHGAATAHGCTYLAVDDPAGLADLDRVAGSVRLLVLPAKTAHRTSQDPATVRDLFTACRAIMSPRGCAVVALATLPDGADAYPHLAPILVPAARQAGLGWLQHIVAVTAPVAGERIRWRAMPADAATIRAATHAKIHMDLLVLTPRVRRHD